MRPLLLVVLPLAALLLPATTVIADPPPPHPELNRLLQREPIDLKNWSKWTPRFREWSNEHFAAAFPAFNKGFQFVKSQRTINGDRLTLPRSLDRDAVAWMLL